VIESAVCKGCEKADSDTRIVINIGDSAALEFHSVWKCAAGGRSKSAVEAVLGNDARTSWRGRHIVCRIRRASRERCGRRDEDAVFRFRVG
jgi:hypothetical protein